MSLAKFAPTTDVGRLAYLLERLVAIDTQNPPGREADAPALLASELDAIGFATEVRPIVGGRANVVARIDNGAGTCSLSTRTRTPFRSAAVGPAIRFV